MVKANPDITFVEVPITAKNSDLHQGLNVTSIPFAHIYYPNDTVDNDVVGSKVSLVEELKISRKHWKTFEKTLLNYVEGSCTIDEL